MRFVVAALLVGGALAIDATVLLVVPVLFALVVPFEKLFPRHRGQKLRRPGLGTDIAFALASPLLQIPAVIVAVVVAVVSLAWVPGLLMRPLVGLLPAAIAPMAAFALFDLAIYWAHRWSHEVPALWRFHKVHHSPAQMDWISGFRVHPLDGIIVAPAIVLLLAAGFSTEVTGVLAVVNFAIGIFLHANVRWRWRPLHRVVMTPEFHHWHHANERDAHCTNYGAFLPVWDIIFGTYYMPNDKRPLRYGIDEPLDLGVARQLLVPFVGAAPQLTGAIRHPVRTVRSLVADVVRSTRRPRREVRAWPPPDAQIQDHIDVVY